MSAAMAVLNRKCSRSSVTFLMVRFVRPRHSRAQRPSAVSKMTKCAGLLVVATGIVVAGRRGRRQTERLGRRAQRADLVRSLIVLDLDTRQAGDERFLEPL